MRVVVFSLAAVAILSGVSAYADQMSLPALPAVSAVASSSTADEETRQVAEAPTAQLLDVQANPGPSVPATPAAVTPEPSGVVLMATGFLGVGGLMWRRRSLAR